MKHSLIMLAALCLIGTPITICAQSKPGDEPKLDNLPIDQMIEAVAKKTGKKFIVDSRVRAQTIVYGIGASSVNFHELLAILSINNFAAVESENDGLVYVLPLADARSMPIPMFSASKRYDDNELVTKIIPIKSIPAAMLIPPLRSMMPQYAHLAVVGCANSLIVVDHFANLKRLQSVIDAIDKGEPLKVRDCSNEEPKK